jgi:hypothetical protein
MTWKEKLPVSGCQLPASGRQLPAASFPLVELQDRDVDDETIANRSQLMTGGSREWSLVAEKTGTRQPAAGRWQLATDS